MDDEEDEDMDEMDHNRREDDDEEMDEMDHKQT